MQKRTPHRNEAACVPGRTDTPDRYYRRFAKTRSPAPCGNRHVSRASGRDAPTHSADCFEHAIEAAVLGHQVDRPAVLQRGHRMRQPVDRVFRAEQIDQVAPDAAELLPRCISSGRGAFRVPRRRSTVRGCTPRIRATSATPSASSTVTSGACGRLAIDFNLTKSAANVKTYAACRPPVANPWRAEIGQSVHRVLEGGQSWPQPPFRRPEPADSRLRAHKTKLTHYRKLASGFCKYK